MPELSRARSVSRSAFLELQDELQLVKNGYEFLDEERILLAAEMLRQRETYRAARETLLALAEKAAAALLEAAADQGLDGLQVQPVTELSGARVRIKQRPYVGQIMIEAGFDTGDAAEPGQPVVKSALVRDCRDSFRQLLMIGVRIAAMETNLRRLMHEYRRTERRVRGLENVVMPEIREDLAMMEEHLDLNEQEEVLRVRSVRGLGFV